MKGLPPLGGATDGWVLTVNSALASGFEWAAPTGGGGGGAPVGASYVTVALDGTLTSERRIQAGTGLGLMDGGAGGDLTVSVTDAELVSWAGLTSAADKVGYFTGSGTAATASLTSFGRSLIASANAAAAQTVMSLVPGTDVQAYDADLTALAASGANGAAQGALLYRDGSGWTTLAAPAGPSVLTLAGASANPVWGVLATGGLTSVWVDTAKPTGITYITPSTEFAVEQTLGALTNAFDPGTSGISQSLEPVGMKIPMTGPTTGTRTAGYYATGNPFTQDILIWACVRISGALNQNTLGLLLMQGTGSTDDLYQVGIRSSSATTNVLYRTSTFTAYNAGTEQATFSGGEGPVMLAISFRASDNQVATWAGISSRSLMKLETRTLGFTPTLLGLAGQGAQSSGININYVEFIRIKAVTYTVTVPDLMSGARLL